MPSLEYVVRPYTSPDPFGRILIPSVPVGTTQRATLTWGAKATMPTVNTGVDFTVACCKEDLKEDDRDSETNRIFQNGDKSSPNWVDVERPKKVRLQRHEANTCGDNWEQISGVAAQVSEALGGFAQDVLSGTAARPQSCQTQWEFANV
jgi:hypothetical protein